MLPARNVLGGSESTLGNMNRSVPSDSPIIDAVTAPHAIQNHASRKNRRSAPFAGGLAGGLAGGAGFGAAGGVAVTAVEDGTAGGAVAVTAVGDAGAAVSWGVALPG